MTIIISIFRTDNAVKNRWHSSMRSKSTRKGSDVSDGEAASKENKMPYEEVEKKRSSKNVILKSIIKNDKSTSRIDAETNSYSRRMLVNQS